jgi:zinc D-Ala-D-Ala carboxypeptidase
VNPVDIQNALNSHGFPCGAADGNIGPQTKAAVSRFQQAYCGPNGWLAIDGNPGPATQAALQWVVANNALVTGFSIQEVACKHCGCAYVARALLSAMFKLRQELGGALTCVDAYRCPAHNAAIGGAPDSQHIYGNAFDVVKGAVSEDQAHAAGFHGIGHCGSDNGAIDHLDLRPANADFADAGNG